MRILFNLFKKNKEKSGASEHVLNLENVEKWFYNGRDKKIVLKKTNFIVRRGEFIVLLGVNGSGKTTILQCIAGIDTFDAGRIYYNDDQVLGLKTQNKQIRGREYAFYVSPLIPLPAELRLKDFMTFWKSTRGMNMEMVLSYLNLEEAELKNYPEKSTSLVHNKVKLGQALLKGSDIIILDEVLSELSTDEKEEYLHICKNIAKSGKTSIILATDDLSATPKGAKIIRISNGTIH